MFIHFSTFNLAEVEMVLKYIKILLYTERCAHRVKETDLGVVTPYSLQAEKIRDKCGFLKDIIVGPAEVLQGKEKQIIIVSTVSVGVNTLTEFVLNYRVFQSLFSNKIDFYQ